MNHLPTGTVSFLFTDIEGSTRLAQQHPAELPSLLARHHAILHEAIQAYNGYVFQIIGDAFSAAFHTASDALRAALAAQRGLQHEAWQPTGIKVRMGIHTGMAQAGAIEERAGGYVGYLTLTRTQRVMSAAHGEQVLLSNAAAELIGNDLPAEATMRDMGEHRLKGLDTPDRLWQLLAPDLRQTFPALQSANVIINNLPTQLTPLIGREAELAQLVDLLVPPNPQSPILNPQPPRPAPRLITITGMGGIGKTLLTQVVAAQVQPFFDDGVIYIPLVGIRDAALFVLTLAQVFEIRDPDARTLLDKLINALRERHILIVLDNFEQISAAAEQVMQLLQNTRNLKMLITSRVSLNIAGERLFKLGPLELLTTLELLKDRTQALGLSLDWDKHYATLRTICQHLDGVPLAVELVAKQLRLISPRELQQRIAGAAALGNEHRRKAILQHTIQRSYDLLTHPQQRLFRQLGVFVDGANLAALEPVCDRTNDEMLEDDLLALIDSSLLRYAVSANDESRYVMHELVREYARELISLAGEIEFVATRHAYYFADLALAWRDDYIATFVEVLKYKRRCEGDLANFRAAWTFIEQHILQSAYEHKTEALEYAQKLYRGLFIYYMIYGNINEHYAILHRLFDYRGYFSPVNLADLFYELSQELWTRRPQGQVSELERLKTAVNEGLQLGQRLGDLVIEGYFSMCRAVLAMRENDDAYAWQSLHFAYEIGNRAVQEHERQNPLFSSKIMPGSKSYLDKAYYLIGGVTQIMMFFYEYESKYHEALVITEEGLSVTPKKQGTNVYLRRLLGYARILTGLGRIADAKAALTEALKIIQADQLTFEVPYALFSVTTWVTAQEDFETAARWMRATDKFYDELGGYIGATGEQLKDNLQSKIQSTMHFPAIHAAWEAGQLLTPETAVEEMLSRLMQKA